MASFLESLVFVSVLGAGFLSGLAGLGTALPVLALELFLLADFTSVFLGDDDPFAALLSAAFPLAVALWLLVFRGVVDLLQSAAVGVGALRGEVWELSLLAEVGRALGVVGRERRPAEVDRACSACLVADGGRELLLSLSVFWLSGVAGNNGSISFGVLQRLGDFCL